MTTSAQYAEEVRSLKAQHAPRVMVGAAVETYTILARKEAAAEHLHTLKTQGATPDEVREANNALKSIKELDAAREKVILLKESRATPSEVSAAVEHFNTLKSKAADPSTSSSYPLSPDMRPSLTLEAKIPMATLPSPVLTSYSNPLTPIPEHGPLNPKKGGWLYGLPTSVLIWVGLTGAAAYAWHRIDETYLRNTLGDSIQSVQPTTDEPGRIEAIKLTAAQTLTTTKLFVHLFPSTVVSLAAWASFQASRRLRKHFGISTARGKGWYITAPVLTVGLAIGVGIAGSATSFILQRIAAQLGLSFLRTLVMGARTK